MSDTKRKLIERYGLICMLCLRETKLRDLQWHHIKPKYVFKVEYKKVDNSIKNGALLCDECHKKIHTFLWWDYEYQKMTSEIKK